MTNETDAMPASTTAPGPGARLKAEREAQQQTIEQAARHLRLDEATVLAIEADRYPAQVPVTFLRGYLRAYAKWLELPADDIVAAYNARQPDEATLEGLKTLLPLPETSGGGGGKWLFGSAMAVLVLLAIVAVVLFMPGDWWQQWQRSNETAATTEASAAPTAASAGELALQLAPEEPLPMPTEDNPAVAEPVSAVSTPAAAAASTTTTASTGSSTGNTSATTAPKPAPVVTEPVAAAGEILEFVFDADCWIRVTDNTGAVLSVGIKENGQRIRLSGAGPLTVVLGNPAGVSLKHNGRPVDLSGYAPERPATLTIQAPTNE